MLNNRVVCTPYINTPLALCNITKLSLRQSNKIKLASFSRGSRLHRGEYSAKDLQESQSKKPEKILNFGTIDQSAASI